MRFLLVLFLLAFDSSSLFSQNSTMLQEPLSSKRFNAEKFAAIRGTPFLFDKWLFGSVLTSKGEYDNLELKFNIYDNTILINKQDDAAELNENISSFTLNQGNQILLFRKSKLFSEVNASQYFQVLVDGKIPLYKLHVKKLAEMSEINAGIVQTFTNSAKYYIEINNALQTLKTDKESIIKLFSSKEEKINSFLNENKISFRKEDDIVKLFNYINSIFQ